MGSLSRVGRGESTAQRANMGAIAGRARLVVF